MDKPGFEPAVAIDARAFTDTPAALFHRAVAANGLRHGRMTEWVKVEPSSDFAPGEVLPKLAADRPDAESLELMFALIYEGDSGSWVASSKDAVVHFAYNEGQYQMTVVAASEDLANHLYQRVDGLFVPESPPVMRQPDTVPVTFWSMSGDRPTPTRRDLEVPSWSEISMNYPTAVRGALDKLMALEEPEAGGKMILWHGPPGGGKSYSLRSLCKSWRDWVDVHYVVDPERFFGIADYMMTVLMAPSGQVGEQSDMEFWEMFDTSRRGRRRIAAKLPEAPRYRYKLLILEDSGEFLASDASKRQGQALSRLLNITDGMLGQGLKFMVLISTNEPFDQLHQAVVRPGRCLANVKFGPFSSAESKDWLAAHSLPATQSSSEMMLAELYEQLSSQQQVVSDIHSEAPGQYL